MIRHHPAPELLLDYATGVVGEGLALIVATHAALCPECRAEVRALEAIGGDLLMAMTPEPVGDDLLAATLARLDEPPAAVVRTRAADDAHSPGLPAPLRRYVTGGLGNLPWRSVGRLFQEARLPLASKAVKVSLMRLRPASLMPKHTHRGHEYTLVLAGGFRDGTDQFGPGDFSAKDTADQHQPLVDKDEECLCLVVLDAPLKLTGAVGRLVNPFLRI